MSFMAIEQPRAHLSLGKRREDAALAEISDALLRELPKHDMNSAQTALLFDEEDQHR